MTISKLKLLQNVMKQKQIDAFIVPTSDPHKSEYIADFYKCRQWISGFKGSAGTVVVTKNYAGLWTDSRYFIQAEKELEKPFVLHKMTTRLPEHESWLINNLKPKSTVGIDSNLFSAAEVERLKNKFTEKQIEIIDAGDVFVEIWDNRPKLPNNEVFVHNLEYCYESRVSKIERVREYLKKNKIPQILFSALDDIAWVLNLRGSDIDYNPVFISFCYISDNESVLFVGEDKVGSLVKQELNSDGVKVQAYDRVNMFLSELKDKSKIIVDKNSLNFNLLKTIENKCDTTHKASIVSRLKAIKNSVEIENYKKSQVKDGVAMCNFLYWLEKNVKNKNITEYEAALEVGRFRSEQEKYIGESFCPISAYQENAALPHYSANKNKSSTLKPKGMYLIDSGGQYLDGTTDITRTVALGEVTDEQKTDFTLVLKGHIRLARAKFPKRTKGFHLDTLARFDLWARNKDFGHGTGHGIGFCLNVHEGPQGFSSSELGNANTEILPGMLTTNEPGFYLEGKYGIRIENVLLCKQDNTCESGDFFMFETVTYCPIDKRLIDNSIMSQSEIDWVNNYHKTVYNLLKKYLQADVLEWLEENTLPL